MRLIFAKHLCFTIPVYKEMKKNAIGAQRKCEKKEKVLSCRFMRNASCPVLARNPFAITQNKEIDFFLFKNALIELRLKGTKQLLSFRFFSY